VVYRYFVLGRAIKVLDTRRIFIWAKAILMWFR